MIRKPSKCILITANKRNKDRITSNCWENGPHCFTLQRGHCRQAVSNNFDKCFIKSDNTLGRLKSRTIRVQLTNLTVYKKGELFSCRLFVEGVIFVWGIFNLQKYCCNLFCTRPLHKGNQGCTSLHFWVPRIHQWCSTWSIRHCMTSYHNRQGKHWRSFRHQGPASTFHLLQPPFSS